jgi:flagellar protein FliS
MWKDTYLESRIMAADPLELVTILYECGISTLQDARGHLASGDIALRAKAISKVISVISELHGSLDHAAGGPIAKNLASLYDYMKHRLTIGNMQQKDEPLEEVEALLRTLAEGWTAISRPSESARFVTTKEFDSVRSNMPFVLQPEFRGTAESWSA